MFHSGPRVARRPCQSVTLHNRCRAYSVSLANIFQGRPTPVARRWDDCVNDKPRALRVFGHRPALILSLTETAHLSTEIAGPGNWPPQLPPVHTIDRFRLTEYGLFTFRKDKIITHNYTITCFAPCQPTATPDRDVPEWSFHKPCTHHSSALSRSLDRSTFFRHRTLLAPDRFVRCSRGGINIKRNIC